jgi:lipopolysaccharide/colanic/teichoic acid biosynthesis glycosyltransferase
MRCDAEASTGAVWATKNDSRITAVGSFLRKTRLGELPQLINVLKGEMSLIGPRPERPEMVGVLEQELPSFHKRHQVRAGITGLAQVEHGYAGCTESYRRKLALDLLYVKRRCLLLDLRIAIRTIFVVITGNGAR